MATWRWLARSLWKVWGFPCELVHFSDASQAQAMTFEQQVETYVARNPSSVTEPMVVVVVKTLHDLCRSEIEKGAAR